jgi:branched-chain amino acid transport system substrate-binding protein
MKRPLRLLAACTLALGASYAWAQTQGISRDEISVGTILDLSGPVASVGKPVLQGMRMRADELNEIGGLHGRKLRVVAEDAGYDVKKSVLAAQKLAGQDKVFAVLGLLGTPMNIAAMPVLFERNVINFYPMSAARETYDPPHRLKAAFLPGNYDQIRVAAARLVKDQRLKKPCALYQDDDFGLEVVRGAQAGLKAVGTTLVEQASYKRGATDLSSQVARLKAAGCDLVVLGTVVRETAAAMSEAAKTGFQPVFVSTTAAYSSVLPRLGGKAVDGLYATMTAEIPSADSSTDQLLRWSARYRTRFNEDPNEYGAFGYHIMDAFIRTAQKAGPSLSTDSFLKALESGTVPRDMFGIMEASFRADKRLGNRYSRLSRLQDGKWRVVSDYVTFNGLKVQFGKDGRMSVLSEQFAD